eukprot:SM000022S07144  [mRNA]  locus=s22:147310:147626:- [translate_table: standard]
MARAAAACLLVVAVLAVTAMRAADQLFSSAPDSLGMEADWPADKHERRDWPLIYRAGILPPGALT